MNGCRLAKCTFCRILHSVSLNRRIHSIQKLRRSHGLLKKAHGVTFSTYQRLMKQNDDAGSSSSSSESDSSDSDSDVETGRTRNVSQENIKTDTLLARLKGGKFQSPNSQDKAESGMDSLLNALGKTAASSAKKPTSEESVESLSKLKDVLSSNANLISETQKLSKVLPGDQQENESKLMGQLLNQFQTTADQKIGVAPKSKEKTSKPQSLSDIVKGLAVLKKPEASTRKAGKTRDGRRERQTERDILGDDHETIPLKTAVFRKPGIGLFNGKPLGIFSKEYMKTAKKDKPSLFDVVKEEEKSLLSYYPPENGFQEHIQWTKEGKLWTFPIDNEAGWEEEKNTSFEDHVFLENELIGFPRKGPIRHFMELVTVALSKNPYLTAEQKRENIEWYRDYFSGKQDMLEERFGEDGVVLRREALQQ